MFFIKSKGKYYAFSEDSKIIINANYSEKDKEKKKSTTYHVLKGIKNGAIGGAILGAGGGTVVGFKNIVAPNVQDIVKYRLNGGTKDGYIIDTVGHGIGKGALYGTAIGAGYGALKGYLKSQEKK